MNESCIPPKSPNSFHSSYQQKKPVANATNLPTPPTTSPTTSNHPHDVNESPSTRAVLQAIRLRKAGRNSGCKNRFRLRLKEYQRLLEILQSDKNLQAFFEDKIRYHYYSHRNCFVFRMPSLLHNGFVVSVEADIENQLRRIRQDESPSARFAKKIEKDNSDIKPLDDQFGKHSPDSAFRVSDTQIPGVVLEVSYSQSGKDLVDLADDYILGSNANCRVMIAFNIEYNKHKEASFSIWRPKKVFEDEEWQLRVQKVQDQLFRDFGGEHIPSGGLTISLKDFANTLTIEQQPQPLDAEIHIEAGNLFEYLERAEKEHFASIEGKLLIAPMPEGLKKKRRRSPTPLEDSPAEEDEDHAPSSKRIALDSSYEASSHSSDEEKRCQSSS